LFGLTELYRAISRKLPPDTADIRWITTNEFWTEYLVADGVERKYILQLIYSPDDFLDAETKAGLIREIAACEKCGEMTINSALMMDRFLAERPRSDVNDYVVRYYRDIKRFLTENRITHVFAEPTNFKISTISYSICSAANWVSSIFPRGICGILPSGWSFSTGIFRNGFSPSPATPRMRPAVKFLNRSRRGGPGHTISIS